LVLGHLVAATLGIGTAGDQDPSADRLLEARVAGIGNQLDDRRGEAGAEGICSIGRGQGGDSVDENAVDLILEDRAYLEMQSAAAIHVEVDRNRGRAGRQQVDVEIAEHAAADRSRGGWICRRCGAIWIDDRGVDDRSAKAVAQGVAGEGCSGCGASNLKTGEATSGHEGQRGAGRRRVDFRRQRIEAASQTGEELLEAFDSFAQGVDASQAAAELERSDAVAAAVAREGIVVSQRSGGFAAKEGCGCIGRKQALEDGAGAGVAGVAIDAAGGDFFRDIDGPSSRL